MDRDEYRKFHREMWAEMMEARKAKDESRFFRAYAKFLKGSGVYSEGREALIEMSEQVGAE